MEEFWILILVAFFVTNSLDKTESVQLEELPLQTFDELFVEEWLDKNEAEDLQRPPTNFGQNVHHQIDRQNTQIGQTKPNSTDQNPLLTESDHSGQIEPNSIDQNPPLTESDHSGQIELNSTDQNPATENIAEDARKRTIVGKFHAIKDKFKQKGKYSTNEWVQIEENIAKHLKVNRKKIYKWKKEFSLTQRNLKNERKNLVEKFDKMKAELKRDGFKNSYKELDKTVAKELGISDRTIYRWKRKLGQTTSNKHAHSKQMELINRYYEIKDTNSKFSDKDIAKMLNIATRTLYKWKKQFKRQQLDPNSVDGHSVEDNAGSNVQEIENSNSESF